MSEEYKLFPGCVIQNRIPFLEASAKFVFEKVGLATSPAKFACCPNPVGLRLADNTTWAGLSTGAWCSYDNNSSNVETYGLLYNWFTVVDDRDVAPDGWHVPTDEEWKKLEMYLGMSQSEADIIGDRGTDEGSKLKSTSGWRDNGGFPPPRLPFPGAGTTRSNPPPPPGPPCCWPATRSVPAAPG